MLEVIEVEAFYGDDSLDEVVLPEGTVSIGSRAFANSSLRRINLPDSLTIIANASDDKLRHSAVVFDEQNVFCS